MTFEIALTGINAASVELNSISNNIANNATTGFKRSSIEFADVYATSAFGAANPATGQGVRVSNIRQEFLQGDLSFTTRNLDLAVEGQGMFRLENGGSAIYTRAGNFGLDREGYIVNNKDQKLTGYGVDGDGEITPIQQTLRIDYADIQPHVTSSVELQMNLDIKADVLPPFNINDGGTFNFSTSVSIYDSLGASQVANVYFRKDAPNTWTAFTAVDGVEISQVGGDEISFDSSGQVIGVNGTTDTTFATNTFNPASGANPMGFTIDVSEISQFDNAFGVNKITQDGFSAGRLEDFDIDPTGVLFGRFSNGQSKIMGQVTLTSFPNQPGLNQVGDTSWAESYDSGQPATGVPNSASLGSLQSGALEGSNVDLTSELVAMIGAQRSFQANAQVISTGDTITQTVINIRR
ncbi:MAG: flagellar hook protein FlgE [Granulosicoccus sp.]